ncbi:hypothetical protein BC835DRAFT_1380548 [Cytidiella melzeri]|nr:hypothetical protein BC835DRAFT_1380548 [Cytidiella melzeri]
MEFRRYLPAFLTSSLLSFLIDYLGLAKWTQQLLSSVVVKHLLPSPPPTYTISYRERQETTWNPLNWPASAPQENENPPLLYVIEKLYHAWESKPPLYAFDLQWTHVCAVFIALTVIFYFKEAWSSQPTAPPQPRRTLIELAFSEFEDLVPADPPEVALPPDDFFDWISRNSPLLPDASLWLTTMLNFAVDCCSRLHAFYLYVTGATARSLQMPSVLLPFNNASRGNLSFDVNPAAVNEIGEPPADDFIQAESVSVVSSEGALIHEPPFKQEFTLLLPQHELNSTTNVISNPGSVSNEGLVRNSAQDSEVGIASLAQKEEGYIPAPSGSNGDIYTIRDSHNDARSLFYDVGDQPSPVAYSDFEFAEEGGSLSPVRTMHSPLEGTLVASPLAPSSGATDEVVSPADTQELPRPSAGDYDSPVETVSESEPDRPQDMAPGFDTALSDVEDHNSARRTVTTPREPSGDVDVLEWPDDSPAAVPLGSSDVFGSDFPACSRDEATGVYDLTGTGLVSEDDEDEELNYRPRARTRTVSSFGLGIRSAAGTSVSPGFFHAHGNSLAVIPEDSESAHDHISTPSSPETRMGESLILTSSPFPNDSPSPLVTPHDFGTVMREDLENFGDVSGEALHSELLDRPTFTTSFPLILRDLDVIQSIDEELDDWDWTLVKIALHEQNTFVRPKPPVVTTQTAAARIVDDPFVVASSSPTGPSNAAVQELRDDEDRPRITSDSIQRRIQDFLREEVDIALHSLTPEQATLLPGLCDTLGLILPDRSARAYYSMAGYQLSLQEEKEILNLASIPRLRRRHSSFASKAPTGLPRGYGLSRHSFLGMYTALSYSADMTYANISRRGLSPSPTASPASVSPVSAAGSLEAVKTLKRTSSWLNMNRSRGGADVSVNGANLKAQSALLGLRKQRSLGSVNSPTPRSRLHSILTPGQKSTEVPGAGRARTRSPSPSTPHSVWVRDKIHENRENMDATSSASASASPVFGGHRRWASQLTATSLGSPSPGPTRASPVAPQGIPRRRMQSRSPLPDRSAPSSAVGSPTPSGVTGKGRGKDARVPASRGSRPPGFRIHSPVPSSAKTVFTTAQSGGEERGSSEEAIAEMMKVTVYARVDDEEAVRRFEEEQGICLSGD